MVGWILEAIHMSPLNARDVILVQVEPTVGKSPRLDRKPIIPRDTSADPCRCSSDILIFNDVSCRFSTNNAIVSNKSKESSYDNFEDS